MSDVESLSDHAKSRRRWLAYALFLVLLAVTGAAIAVVFVSRPPRFVRNWPGIKLGMSKEEVVGLLGEPTGRSGPATVKYDGDSPVGIAAAAGIGAALLGGFDEYWTWESKYDLPNLFAPPEESFVVYFDSQGRVKKCRPPITGPYASLYKAQGNTE
jgi:hypothetical protein